MSRGGCSRPESSWNRSCRSRHWGARFQSRTPFSREHHSRDMSSSENWNRCIRDSRMGEFFRWLSPLESCDTKSNIMV
eukprot:gene7749-biopygen158